MSSLDSNYTEDNILIIKGRFKAYSTSFYGQFILIFTNDKKFETYNAVVSTFSDLYNLEPHAEWTEFEESIAKIKWKGNFNANMTTSLMDHFKKFSEEMNSVGLLFDYAYDYDYKALDIHLFDLINRIVHDKNLLVETSIQEVSPSDYRSTREKAAQTVEKEKVTTTSSEEAYSLEEGSTILTVKPIVSPVKGKPIYELRIGDRLIVKIPPNTDRSNYFIDYLELREESGIKPVPAEVVDIKAGSGKTDPVEILTSITTGLYGRFTEEERQVKLRMYNPSSDGPILTRGKEHKDQEKGKTPDNSESFAFSKGTLVMLGLFFLILILFIVLIIISW